MTARMRMDVEKSVRAIQRSPHYRKLKKDGVAMPRSRLRQIMRSFLRKVSQA